MVRDGSLGMGGNRLRRMLAHGWEQWTGMLISCVQGEGGCFTRFRLESLCPKGAALGRSDVESTPSALRPAARGRGSCVAGPAPELRELLADARRELPVPIPGDRSRTFRSERESSDRAGGQMREEKKSIVCFFFIPILVASTVIADIAFTVLLTAASLHDIVYPNSLHS